LSLEEFVGQHTAATFQALHIHYPALDGVVLHNLAGPLAELHCPFIFDLEAHRNDGLQAVVINLSLYLPAALGLNY